MDLKKEITFKISRLLVFYDYLPRAHGYITKKENRTILLLLFKISIYSFIIKQKKIYRKIYS
jgi:hypothetical protein